MWVGINAIDVFGWWLFQERTFTAAGTTSSQSKNCEIYHDLLLQMHLRTQIGDRVEFHMLEEHVDGTSPNQALSGLHARQCLRVMHVIRRVHFNPK